MRHDMLDTLVSFVDTFLTTSNAGAQGIPFLRYHSTAALPATKTVFDLDPTKTTRLDLHLGDRKSQPQLRLHKRCLCLPSKLDQAFVVSMKSPDIVWVLMSSRQARVEAEIGAVNIKSLLDGSLLELESGVRVTNRLHP